MFDLSNSGLDVIKLKPYIRAALLFAVLIFGVWFCWSNQESFAKLWTLPPSNLALILTFYFCFHLLNAAMASYQLARRSTYASVWQILVINCYSSLMGYLTIFRAGYYGGKVYFYQKLYDTPIAASLGMMGYLSLLVMTVTSVFGLILAGLANYAGVTIQPLYWLSLIAAIGFCALLAAALYGVAKKNWFPRNVQRWISDAHLVFEQTASKEAIVLISMTALSIAFQIAAFWAIFSGYGMSFSVVTIGFLAVFSNLSLLVSLTPANLGVRELIAWLMVSHLGLDSGDFVSVMIVDRILQMLLLIAICILGYPALQKSANN